MRIRGLDNKHPPGQQLCVQKAAVEAQLEQLYTARSALGLDDWLDSLSQDDRQIIQLVYEEGYSYQAAAPMVNMSKTGLQYRIDQICKSPYAYG
nr:sigma factor-like helix-turn-helix DNA-binding protein [Holdemania sp. 1001302B_160321_E10]